jgi:hypothetical protein
MPDMALCSGTYALYGVIGLSSARQDGWVAETVPITALGPRLEGVLGPLRPDEESRIRKRLLAAGSELVDLARDLAGRAGWHGQGLELDWAPSGQLAISRNAPITVRR